MTTSLAVRCMHAREAHYSRFLPRRTLPPRRRGRRCLCSSRRDLSGGLISLGCGSGGWGGDLKSRGSGRAGHARKSGLAHPPLFEKAIFTRAVEFTGAETCSENGKVLTSLLTGRRRTFLAKHTVSVYNVLERPAA